MKLHITVTSGVLFIAILDPFLSLSPVSGLKKHVQNVANVKLKTWVFKLLVIFLKIFQLQLQVYLSMYDRLVGTRH